MDEVGGGGVGIEDGEADEDPLRHGFGVPAPPSATGEDLSLREALRVISRGGVGEGLGVHGWLVDRAG
ncbi:MAG: hypothetical protein D6692_11565 [Planctomycetota bacterium]|nr:MAG: hypothetical protein D6692_11565 [Planctomycetota bacterium]